MLQTCKIALNDINCRAEDSQIILNNNHNAEVRLHRPKEVSAKVKDGILSFSTNNLALLHTVKKIVYNGLKGLIEPYKRAVDLVGTGYNVKQEDDCLVFNLGFSHLIRKPMSKEIDYKLVGAKRIQLSSPDKQLLGQELASLEKLRFPNSYTGNGIKIEGKLYIRRKAKKG
jgi:large subunit ribosomal protein L6